MFNQPFKMPPLEWVRAFEAAARCGSFTAAAAETGLTQSAISQRIGHLEKLLGTKLFYRRARSIELTVDGEAWLPHVRIAFGNLRQSSDALFGPRRGRISFSASQSIINLWLLPRLTQLKGLTAGQLSIQSMVLGSHDAPSEDVIGIRYGAGAWPQMYKMQLFKEKIAPLASPALVENSGSWTEWPRIACAGLRPNWTDWSHRYGTPTTPIPHLRFDTFFSALGAATAGAGVLLGSLPLCAEYIRTGRLIRLGEDILEHHESYWAIAGSDAIRQAQWDELIKVLAEN